MPTDRVFLLSSMTENPDRFFQGYFFHGADYVYGQAGFDEFRSARGVDRLVREDGCYVQAERAGSEYRFSTDYNGYKKLFYFWADGFWVVSNSLRQIARHLRKHGYPVHANVPQVAAMAAEGTLYPSGRGSFFSQLTTLDTIVRGVRLVPADCALWIGPSGVRTERIIWSFPGTAYDDRLGRFISVWLGRLRILARDPSVQMTCDLTGGLDSRAVFALLRSAVRGGGIGLDERLQVCSGGRGIRTWRDRAVAAKICDHFDLRLNGRSAQKPRWLKASTAYRLWKDLCLGTYHPIYFPNVSPSGRVIHLRGGGGENHRPFYSGFIGAPSADRFVAARARNLAHRAARPEFESTLGKALEQIREDAPDGLDPLACHYRHFRNRFHAGLHPQYGVTLQPLGSKLLDGVTAAAGKSRFQNGQVLYDLLYNLEPALLDIPFDSPRKRPSRAVRRHLTAATECSPASGACFIGEVPPAQEEKRKKKRRKRKVRAIDRLHDEFARAKDGYSLQFLGKAYVRRAERTLQAAVRAGDFPGPVASKRIAVVMACAMLDC